jgi:DNA-binding MarR family transcriptional regulator
LQAEVLATMLTQADAKRIISFCLSGSYEVELEIREGGCALRVVPLGEGAPPPSHFQAATFEEVLRAAADEGLVRRECIDRQIAFLTTFNGPPRFDPPAHRVVRSPALVEAPPPEDPAEGKTLKLPHYRGLAEFRYQIRKFVSFSEAAARKAGLEPPQHQLLLAIRGLPPSKRATLVVLAERMCLDVESCGAVADVLLAKRLVKWIASPSDRREMLLALTPAGQRVLRGLTLLHRQQMLAVGPTFVQTLGSILASFDDEE